MRREAIADFDSEQGDQIVVENQTPVPASRELSLLEPL